MGSQVLSSEKENVRVEPPRTHTHHTQAGNQNVVSVRHATLGESRAPPSSWRDQSVPLVGAHSRVGELGGRRTKDHHHHHTAASRSTLTH